VAVRKPPKISIIVPTFNRAHLLSRCITAILAQTLPDFEAIVVSDGSTDTTGEIVGRFADPRIRFIEKENSGQASARNLGMRLARGEYIAFCDDDDRIYAHHLRTLSNMLDNRRDVGLVYSDAVWVHPDHQSPPQVAYSRDFDKKSLENFNYITTQTVLFRSRSLNTCGRFSEHPILRNGLEDWEFWLRLSDRFPFCHIPRVTGEYVIHDGNSFRPGSGYDYNRAFLFVRTLRFRYLTHRYGASLFHHVDHMYPFYLVQCYLENGRYRQALDIADDLFKRYGASATHETGPEAVKWILLFCLGISSIAVDRPQEAAKYFTAIIQDPQFASMAPKFNAFAHGYAEKLSHPGGKDLLMRFFPFEPEPAWNFSE
jgi:glycosyltransferase involved in cell wall biosynthesis